VSVERNVYWDPVEVTTIPHKGEEENQSPNTMILPQEHLPPDPVPPATIPKTPLTISPSKIPILANSPTLDMVTKRVWKLSQQVLDIITNRNPIPTGIQLPTPEVEETASKGETTAEKLIAILDGEDDLAELALALSDFMADTEALEPTTLTEVKRCPDWPQ
jgi:hypothetical protein